MIEWGLLLTAAALIAATIVAVYTLSALKDWIGVRIGAYRNRQIVAGAIRDRIDTGNYLVVPFVFDERENVVLDTDHIEATTLDDELDLQFAGQDEVILEVQG